MNLIRIRDCLEGVIESVTHEDAGSRNCVYELPNPARGETSRLNAYAETCFIRIHIWFSKYSQRTTVTGTGERRNTF